MNRLSDKIQRGLSNLDIEPLYPLSELTSFRIGGNAAGYARLHSAEELKQAIRFCREEGIRYRLIGNGTNILAPDEGFDGLILRLMPTVPAAFDGCRVVCSAGANLSAIAKESVQRGLMGLEALSGIPGTIGGACAMNAGAYGGQLSDVLVRVTALMGDEVREIAVQKGDFGYRRSPFVAPDCIVLEAELMLSPDDGGAKERMAECNRRRREKQPLAYPSAGSVFKRPEGHFAGALVEQCGFKGYAIGDAQVSELHAGFIINRGRATCKDVCELIETIQTVVFERTGVRLEREIKLLEEV